MCIHPYHHHRPIIPPPSLSPPPRPPPSGGRPNPIPGSRGHYREDAAAFVEWQVDYVKLDWCGDIKKQILKGAKAHRDFAAAMANATAAAAAASGKAPHPIFIEVVAGYFFLGSAVAEVADAWRFCTDHHDAWANSQEQLACRLDLVNTGAIGGETQGGWASMDALMTGGAGCVPASKGPHCPGQTDDEYKTNFVLWALTQSPMLVATDVRNLTR